MQGLTSALLDPIGNRTGATNNAEKQSYTANERNQYSQITTDNGQLTTNNLAYDTDGNLTTNGVWSFTWDAENRLLCVSSNGTMVVLNVYDHQSRRIAKITSASTNAFVYDGWLLVSETITHNSSFSTNSYVWGLDLSGTLQGAGGVGGLVSVTHNSSPITHYLACCDANGNITDYIDAAGAVVAHREYDAYGVASEPLAQNIPFWFSSKYLDEESGLCYFGYRYYLPSLGRWLSRDLIKESGGLNVYSYANNSPADRFDRLGLFSHHHGNCPPKRLEKIQKADAEAKRRIGLWLNFLDPGPSDVDINTYLSQQFRRVIRVQDWRLVNIFNRDVKNKAAAIKAGFDGNAYGVECGGCHCNKDTVAYLYGNLLTRTVVSWDDDIHFCDLFFAQTDNEQVAYFLHEMSHYYAGTIENDQWHRPTARLGDSVNVAPLYEDMGRYGRNDTVIEVTYYIWIDAAVTLAISP